MSSIVTTHLPGDPDPSSGPDPGVGSSGPAGGPQDLAPPGAGERVTVRASSSCDLLAAVPHLLGYRPRESLVVVCVGTRRAVELVARVPLDELDELGERDERDQRGGPGGARARAQAPAAEPDPFAHLVTAVRRVDATDLVVALHTERDPREVRPRVEPVLAALEQVGEVEPWLVTPDGYRGLDCADPTCCPPQGRPPEELEHRAVNAALVVAGRTVASTPEDAYRIPRAPADRRSLAARAATRAERAAAGDGAAGYDLWRELVRHAARELLSDGPGAADLPPARLGRLAVALADVAVRDAVLLSLVPGADEVARLTAARSAEAGTTSDPGGDARVESATARAIARMVDPRVAVLPDPTTACAARLVLEQVVAHVPLRRQAPSLTLLGLLAWWQGDGGRAAHRVDLAARLDPGHRLAALLGSVLAAGVPPGWVRGPGANGPDGGAPRDGVG